MEQLGLPKQRGWCGVLPLFSESGTSSIPSFNHVDFHLFNKIITECFLFAWPWTRCWDMGVTMTCFLPLEALWVVGRQLCLWTVAPWQVLRSEKPKCSSFWRSAAKQMGLSNIWEQMSRIQETWMGNMKAGSYSQLCPELERYFPALISCMTLAKSLYFSVLQLICKTGLIMVPSSQS